MTSEQRKKILEAWIDFIRIVQVQGPAMIKFDREKGATDKKGAAEIKLDKAQEVFKDKIRKILGKKGLDIEFEFDGYNVEKSVTVYDESDFLFNLYVDDPLKIEETLP